MSLTKYVPSILIATACVIGFFLPSHAFTADTAVEEAFLYHFSHANIFHLLVNLYCLFQFYPRWKTCFVAFIVSSASALLPIAALDIPTCGLSAFIFACYARKFVSWHLPLWKPLLVQVLVAFMPLVNWRIHLISFILSYIVWYGIYSRRHTR